MTLIPSPKDPTLQAIDEAIERIENSTPERTYCGMSSVNDPCSRKVWYQFRQAKAKDKRAKLIKAAQDGHNAEQLQADRLRLVDGIVLHTIDDNTGEQFSFSWFSNHMQGHADGIITGLRQAPKTTHLWEHKACNQKKYDKFIECKQKFGDKQALINWDIIYYGQSQLYMHFSGLNRHYLTVSLPGGRDTESCRTEYDEQYALELLDKAEKIIFSDNAPRRISESPAWFYCKHFCDFYDICHQKSLPQVNCRTCLHSTPERSEGWSCAKLNEPVGSGMACGGEMHLYLPDMLGGKIRDVDTGAVIYEDGRVNYEGGRVE